MLGTGFGKSPIAEVSCPSCQAINPMDANNCFACGASLKASSEKTNEVTPHEKAAVSLEKTAQKPISHYIEPEAIFASGLPAWDIVPPQVVVRKRRSI